MRTVLFANNHLGMRVGRYLASRGELVGLVVHPEGRRRSMEGLTSIIDGPVVSWPSGRDEIAALEPECCMSVLFAYKLDEGWLKLPSWQPINLHPGLLPWNRGAAPNVWPLVDGSPAGTTLHVMSERIDEGAVIAQRQVAVEPDDTAASLYRRLGDASMHLVEDVWPGIETRPLVPQGNGGSSHRLADLRSLDLGEEDLTVLDKIRARTFAPYGAEFERNGQRWRARVHIERVVEDP